MVPVALNVAFVQVNVLEELFTIPPAKVTPVLEFQGPVVETRPVTLKEPDVIENPPVPIVKFPAIVELPKLLFTTWPLAMLKSPAQTIAPTKDI